MSASCPRWSLERPRSPRPVPKTTPRCLLIWCKAALHRTQSRRYASPLTNTTSSLTRASPRSLKGTIIGAATKATAANTPATSRSSSLASRGTIGRVTSRTATTSRSTSRQIASSLSPLPPSCIAAAAAPTTSTASQATSLITARWARGAGAIGSPLAINPSTSPKTTSRTTTRSSSSMRASTMANRKGNTRASRKKPTTKRSASRSNNSMNNNWAAAATRRTLVTCPTTTSRSAPLGTTSIARGPSSPNRLKHRTISRCSCSSSSSPRATKKASSTLSLTTT